MPHTRPFPYAELHLQYCVSFVTDEMLYKFRHIKLAHIPSPGSQMSDHPYRLSLSEISNVEILYLPRRTLW